MIEQNTRKPVWSHVLDPLILHILDLEAKFPYKMSVMLVLMENEGDRG